MVTERNLKSDGQQFQQYQQNAQSPLTSNHCTLKKSPRHMTLAIHVLAWDSHIYLAGLNRLMGSQSSPPDNFIFNDNTDTNNDEQHSKTGITKITDNINSDSTIAGSMTARS